MDTWLEEAKSLYENGVPYCKIAKIVNKNRKKVSYELRKAGYESDPKYVRNVPAEKLRQYSFDEGIFASIDTEEKAYWLGFLYADGYVDAMKNDVELSLKADDIEHIRCFSEFLSSTYPIKGKHRKLGEKIHLGYSITVTSKRFKDDLMSLGCIPQKTKKLTFPSLIENKLIPHFIRGYFDGDGCVRVRKNDVAPIVEILGTENMLRGILNAVELDNNVFGFKHSDISRIVLSGQKALKILDYMYDDCRIFLNRKKTIYELCRSYSKSQKSMNYEDGIKRENRKAGKSGRQPEPKALLN